MTLLMQGFPLDIGQAKHFNAAFIEGSDLKGNSGILKIEPPFWFV